MKRFKLTPYSIFTNFYITSIFLSIVRDGKNSIFAWALLLISIFLVFSYANRVKFCIFIAISSIFLLTFKFPDVANHVNLIIFCNILIMSGIVYSFLNKKYNTENGFYRIIQPSLRVTLIITYFCAGFHKLNTDYFDLEIGCSREMLNEIISVVDFPNFPLASQFLIAVSILTIIWEVLGAIFLTVPKFQLWILLLAWLMHATLALIGFVDFSALALAFLVTFIPANYYIELESHSSIKFFNIELHRDQFYFSVSAVGAILFGIRNSSIDWINNNLIYGLIFNFASIIFILPLLSICLHPSNRPSLERSCCFRQKNSQIYVYALYNFIIFWDESLLRTTHSWHILNV